MAVLVAVVAVAGLATAVGAQNDDRILRLERRIVAFDGTTERSIGRESTITIDADVLFAFDSADLSPLAIETLDRIAADLADRVEDPEVVWIVGHTDSVGDAAYNLDLSQRRADSVRAALGDTALSYTTEGRGETEPVASNDTADGRRRNRRVEITFTTADR